MVHKYRRYRVEADITVLVPVKVSVQMIMNAPNKKAVQIAMKRMADGLSASQPVEAATTTFFTENIGEHDCEEEMGNYVNEQGRQALQEAIEERVHGPYQLHKVTAITEEK